MYTLNKFISYINTFNGKLYNFRYICFKRSYIYRCGNLESIFGLKKKLMWDS